MKIAILGAGALGCYYGARLQQAGHTVNYIVRSEYDYLKQYGLQVNSVHGDVSLPHIDVFNTPDQVGAADLVLVTWKTTANDHLPAALPPLMHKNTMVVTLQNGMGNAEQIAKLVAPERIYIGLCFICAMRTKPGHILHLEGGNIQFAPFRSSPQGTQQAEHLAALFTAAGVKSKGFEFAEQIQWFKLVWNIPFNGLCLALGGISVQTLYENPANVERARQIMTEIVQVARARGYSLPEDIIEFQLKRTAAMGAFIPSSAVDYNEGRPIEYHSIWAIPLSIARTTGVPLSAWEHLDSDIRKRLGITA